MNGRIAAIAAAAAIVSGVLAQVAFPGWHGFHVWQYAAALVIAATIVVAYVREARRGDDGDLGRRAIVPFIGALVLAIAGLASGLLGPDVDTVSRAPGIVAPLPGIGVAAFFPIADAATIENGSASIELRRRGGPSVVLGPSGRTILGASSIRSFEKTAAYVDARDAAGNHLTITQPTNPSFLSPILFFPQTLAVAGKVLPTDAFAVPAARRQVKAFFIAKGDAAIAHAHGIAGRASVLFVVDDDTGHLVPGAIGIAPSGTEVRVGGLRLRAAVGEYPALEIASIPPPIAVGIGLAIVLAGLAYAFARPTGFRAELAATDGTASS